MSSRLFCLLTITVFQLYSMDPFEKNGEPTYAIQLYPSLECTYTQQRELDNNFSFSIEDDNNSNHLNLAVQVQSYDVPLVRNENNSASVFTDCRSDCKKWANRQWYNWKPFVGMTVAGFGGAGSGAMTCQQYSTNNCETAIYGSIALGCAVSFMGAVVSLYRCFIAKPQVIDQEELHLMPDGQ